MTARIKFNGDHYDLTGWEAAFQEWWNGGLTRTTPASGDRHACWEVLHSARSHAFADVVNIALMAPVSPISR